MPCGAFCCRILSGSTVILAVQGSGILTLHCVPTMPGKSRVFASLYTAASTVPLPLRVMFRHFVCGWWEHIHGGLTILDGDAQLILGQVRPAQTCFEHAEAKM